MSRRQGWVPPSGYYPYREGDYQPIRAHREGEYQHIRAPYSTTPMRPSHHPHPSVNTPRNLPWNEDTRAGRGSQMPKLSAPIPHKHPSMRDTRTDRQGSFSPPPRNIRRTEAASATRRVPQTQNSIAPAPEDPDRISIAPPLGDDENLNSISTVLNDANRNAAIRTYVQLGAEAAERKILGEAKLKEMKDRQQKLKEEQVMENKKKKVTNEQKKPEQQDVVTKDVSKNEARKRSKDWARKICKISLDWFGIGNYLYLGVLILSAMLGTAMYLALYPPRTLAVMTLDLTQLFNGTEMNENSPAAKCGYEVRPPGFHLAQFNRTEYGSHRPLKLDRRSLNITIPNSIELHMFGACVNSQFERTCHFGSPVLPFNWNITRIVGRSITPTLTELDPQIRADLEKLKMSQDIIKEIERKAGLGKPKPARIDLLAWGWPKDEWPKPSSLSVDKDGETTRSALFKDGRIFDGEICNGDVTAIPYNVIFLTMVAGIVFFGIYTLWHLFIGPENEVSYGPSWMGCVLLGTPFAILSIIGAVSESVAYGSSGWRENGCNIIEYAGRVLRPYWISDWLQWYFWGLVVLFSAFAGAFLLKGVCSKYGLWDRRNYGGRGFIGFCSLSLMALLAASGSSQRSIMSKAKTINSISNFLGMQASSGKGVWAVLSITEFVAIWGGLACMSTAFNFWFRERSGYGGNISGNTSNHDVTTKAGAKISAPFTSATDTRDLEKGETAEVAASGTDDEIACLKQAIAKISDSGAGSDRTIVALEQLPPPREDITVVVEQVDIVEAVDEANSDGGDSQRPTLAARVQTTNDARAMAESVAVKQESKKKPGVTSSPTHGHSSDVDAVDERQEVSVEASDEGQGASTKASNERQADDVVSDDQKQDSVVDSVVADDERPDRHKLPDSHAALVSERWSSRAQASSAGGTTPASPTLSERHDGTDENGRSDTSLEGLVMQCDSVTGITRARTPGGHVYNMVTRLSRLPS